MADSNTITIGFNYEPANYFDFMNENTDLQFFPKELFRQAYEKQFGTVTKANKMSEYDQKITSMYKSYWATREGYRQQQLYIAKNIALTPVASNPIVNAKTPYSNIFENRGAWETIASLVNDKQKGSILSFDTETIGSWADTASELERKNLGITEIGIAIQDMNGARMSSRVPKASFVFGISEEQAQWMYDILAKRKNGKTLSKTEESALERASRYSTLDHGMGIRFKEGEIEFNGRKYITIETLNKSRSHSDEDVFNGIKTLRRIGYTQDKSGFTRDEQIQSLIDTINDFSSKKNRVIMGHNLRYDINTINTYANLHGLNGLSDFQYADTMEAMRGYANLKNISSAEFISQINQQKNHGIPLKGNMPNSLETAMEAIGYGNYAADEAHNAYNDSVATLIVAKEFDVNKLADSILQNGEPTKSYNVANSYIKIKRNGQHRDYDFLTYNDDTIAYGHQVSNEYWKLVGTGYQKYDPLQMMSESGKKVGTQLRDAQERFVVKFQSASDSNLFLYKSFQTEQDYFNFLNKDTSIESNVTQKQILAQQEIHDKDLGRRTIEEFFDPNRVGKSYSNGQVTAQGGFASMSKYYSVFNQIAQVSDEDIVALNLKTQSGKVIKNSNDLITNIGDRNIFGTLIDADKFGVKKLVSSSNPSITYNYDAPLITQEVFKAFSNNVDFFDYANTEISKIPQSIKFPDGTSNAEKAERIAAANLNQTIALKQINDLYVTNIAQDISQFSVHTPSKSDIQNIAIKNSSGESFNITINGNINDITNQIKNKFYSDNAFKSTSEIMFAMQELADRGQDIVGLSDELRKGIDTISRDWDDNIYQASSVFANILTKNNSVKALASITPKQYQNIEEQITFRNITGKTNDEIAKLAKIEPGNAGVIDVISAKENKPLLTSATELHTHISGSIDDNFRKQAGEVLDNFSNGNIVISGKGIDKGSNESKTVINYLTQLGYDEKSIESQFLPIFYSHGTNKSAIASFNGAVTGNKKKIVPIFYANTTDDGIKHAYMFIANESTFKQAMDVISGFDSNIARRDVKKQILDYAAPFEIRQLDKVPLGIDKNTLKPSATAYLVKNGKSERYLFPTLNVYTTKGDKLDGRLRAPGEDLLTSLRVRYKTAWESASKGDFVNAMRDMNSVNDEVLSEGSASASRDAVLNKATNTYDKMHIFSINDIDNAHMIATSGEGKQHTINPIEMSKLFAMRYSDKPLNINGVDVNTIEALREYIAFANGLTNPTDKKFIDNIGRYTGSEQYRLAFTVSYTHDTGYLDSIEDIKEGIKNYAGTSQLQKYVNARKNNGQTASMIDLLADVSANLEDEYTTPELTQTLRLMQRLGLTGVGGQSMAKKDRYFKDNYRPQEQQNITMSGGTRDPIMQMSNYRPYQDREFVSEEYLNTLGMTKTSLISSASHIDDMDAVNAMNRAVNGFEVNEGFVGLVRSISDAEKLGKKDADISALQDLSKDTTTLDLRRRLNTNDKRLNSIYKNIYNRLLNGSSYEDKNIMRPSLYNTEAFRTVDTKTIKISELAELAESGSDRDRRFTHNLMNLHRGKELKNGTIIGQYNGKSIIYNGPNISNFRQEYINDLLKTGETIITPERQIEDVKLMANLEKGTTRSIAYYHSSDPAKWEEEVLETMADLGFGGRSDNRLKIVKTRYGSNTLEQNISILNEVTDAVFDVFAPGIGTMKTAYVGNHNIFKHLSDMPINTRWNVVAYAYAQAGSTDKLAKELNNIAGGERFIAEGNRLGVINPAASGNVSRDDILETFLNKIQKDPLTGVSAANKQIIDNLNALADENYAGAFLPIYRTRMNTFQGTVQTYERRYQQTMSMFGREFREGSEFVQLLNQDIINNNFNSSSRIAGGGAEAESKKMHSIWSNIVRQARKDAPINNIQAQRNIHGLMDVVQYYRTADKEARRAFVDSHNVLEINMSELLKHVPTESTRESFMNSIFYINGNASSYLKQLAKQQQVDLDNAHSILVHLDDSGVGIRDFTDNKIIANEVLLPIAHLSPTGENTYYDDYSRPIATFIERTQELIDSNNDNRKEALESLQKSYDEMMKNFLNNTDIERKDSLMSLALASGNLPNSSRALAKDAIAPTLAVSEKGDFTFEELQKIKDIETEIKKEISNGKNPKELQSQINRLDELNAKKDLAVKNQKKRLLDAVNADVDDNYVQNVLNALNLSDRSYDRFVINYGMDIDTGKIFVRKGLQNAAVSGRKFFTDAGIDIGYTGREIFNDALFNGRLKNYDAIERTVNGVKEFKVSNSDIEKVLDNLKKGFKDSKNQDAYNKIQEIAKKYNKWNVTDSIKARKDLLQNLEDTFTNEVSYIEERLEKAHYSRTYINAVKQDFYQNLNTAYDFLGERYLSNVGVLGISTRYPEFHIGSNMPTRFYLSKDVVGSELRNIGTMFTIRQLGDYDGDTISYMLAGNGGIARLDSDLRKKLNTIFDESNIGIEKGSLSGIEDSLKAFALGDVNYYRYSVINDLMPDAVKSLIEEHYGGNMTTEQKKKIPNAKRKLFDTDEFANVSDDTKALIVANGNEMKQLWKRKIEHPYGGLLKFENMVQTSIISKQAKAYIGNYSRVNMLVRNSMLSLANKTDLDDESRKLLFGNGGILENLSDITTGLTDDELADYAVNGILTITEQNGIGTKHIHQVRINQTTAWREGIDSLFKHGKFSGDYREDLQINALTDLLKGSASVLKLQSTDYRTLAEDIAEQGLAGINKKIANATNKDELLHYKSLAQIASLYELSNLKGAYEGYEGGMIRARQKTFEDIANVFEKAKKRAEEGHAYTGNDLQSMINDYIVTYGSNEMLTTVVKTDNGNGKLIKRINNGDMIFYHDQAGNVFAESLTDFKSSSNGATADFDEIEITAGKQISKANHVSKSGISIRDLNKNIKEHRPGDKNSPAVQFDVHDETMNLLSSNNFLKYRSEINATAREDMLNSLLQQAVNATSASDTRFRDLFSSITSANNANTHYIKKALGTDADIYYKNANNLYDVLYYAEEHSALKGDATAKELMRQMNRDIAKHPRSSISGSNPYLSVNVNPLLDLMDMPKYDENDLPVAGYYRNIILNTGFLDQNLNLDYIKASNSVMESLESNISTINQNIQEPALNWYKDIAKGDLTQQEILDKYDNLVTKTNKTIKDIMDKAYTPNIEGDVDEHVIQNAISSYMGWDGSKTTKMVGYGQFFGEDINQLHTNQINYITNELNSVLADANTDLNNNQRYAIEQTLKQLSEVDTSIEHTQDADFLDFSSIDALRDSTKKINDTIEGDAKKQWDKFSKMMDEANAEAMGKAKTNPNGIIGRMKKAYSNFNPFVKVAIPIATAGIIGGAIIGGLAKAGQSPDSESNYQKMNREDKNKSATMYPNEDSDAKRSGMQQRRLAPATKNQKTIYSEPKSSYNYHVRGKTNNRKSAQDYNNIASRANPNNGNTNIYSSYDNSGITDNWLENKFSDLSE